MKLLIITQKVDINDDNLGFFHSWIEKFSEKLDKLYVICLWKGEYNLPGNVIVFSMGKEEIIGKLGQLTRLQKNLVKILPDVDGVFVHMNPIFAILSFPLTKIFSKKLVLWYAHGSVSFLLKLAEKLVDKIVTSSLDGCRIKSQKIRVLGQGIDTEQFKPSESSALGKKQDSKFKILSIGRISPVKDQETLIKAIDILINEKAIKNIEVKIIGTPIEDYEKDYLAKLKNLMREKKLGNYIKFLGGIPYREIASCYQNSDLLINTSFTGSMDKVVLEAMASGCLVLNCNEAYKEILDKRYMFEKRDFKDLASKILNLKDVERNGSLREIVVKNHNLDNLIYKIINIYE